MTQIHPDESQQFPENSIKEYGLNKKQQSMGGRTSNLDKVCMDCHKQESWHGNC